MKVRTTFCAEPQEIRVDIYAEGISAALLEKTNQFGESRSALFDFLNNIATGFRAIKDEHLVAMNQEQRNVVADFLRVEAKRFSEFVPAAALTCSPERSEG